jgi:beta-glucosidase
MKLKKLICLFLLLTLFWSAPSQISAQRFRKTPSKKSHTGVEQRINLILARMTLEEKLGQLQQLDGHADGRYRDEFPDMIRQGLLGSTLNVRGAKRTNELQRIAMNESRLKIPFLFAFDVIHGYRTIFPVPLGEAASWDTDLAERNASISASESSAVGLKWTFAPMVDIARDPRWGRVVEGSGEDPFLGAMMARARVRGFQGKDMSMPDKIMACAKHWVAYGAAEAGRDYNSTDISERTLREIYFPPFKAAVDEGVGSFMTSFNDISGVPATANPFTLKQVLRGEWKFDGIVVSDYTAVMELMNHGLARDEADAAQYALNAGTDMEMVSRLYNKYGTQLLKEGKLTPGALDEAVRRILRIKFRLGLFENPYVDESREAKELLKPEYREAARTAAARSMVLLKNERETLPLNKNIKSIALVGPLVDERRSLNGSWAGDGRTEDAVTLFEGIKSKVGSNTKINYAKGCDINSDKTDEITEAVRAANESDFVIVAVGEDADMSGEAASRSDINLPGKQMELVKAIHATGKPYAVVLMNGRPLTINWIAENSPAILETWFGGTMAGPAIADVLFGDVNPGGKLPITFPRSVGQIPIYYNHKNTGRPFDANNKYTSKYLDIPNTPLYPFGFGLSYTTFELRDLRLNKTTIKPNGSVEVSVEVENTGRRAGDEVVQLYICDVTASVTRPVRELKGFQRITLKAGGKCRVTFTLTSEHLGFYNRDMKFVVEPGEFKICVSTSSVGGLESKFTVEK